MHRKVTPPREIGVAGRLVHDGAHDGDLEVGDLVGGNGRVIHLRETPRQYRELTL